VGNVQQLFLVAEEEVRHMTVIMEIRGNDKAVLCAMAQESAKSGPLWEKVGPQNAQRNQDSG